jgi:hypothetical protein
LPSPSIFARDAQGGAHLIEIRTALQLTGVGEYGTAYRVVGGQRFRVNNTAPFNEEGRPNIITFTLLANGIFLADGTRNFLDNLVFHITVDADGNWLAEVHHEQMSCRGQG